jgi:serine/threonine protein kinase
VQIGSGSFATVYKATNTTGHTFAIKKIALQQNAKPAQIRRHKESLEREINVLKTCRSPYIVSYFGSFISADGAMCIVMEFLEGGCLHDVIKKYNEFGGLDEKSSQGVLRCVLLGLHYLHSEGYVHRDL